MCSVAKCRVEIFGRVTLTEQEDPPRLPAPLSRWRGAQLAEKIMGALPHALESVRELILIHGGLPNGTMMKSPGIQLEPTAAGHQLMGRHAFEIGSVDEEFPFGDAYRQDVGDVIVRDGVSVSLPVDVAVDAAHAIDHARGVVGVTRQGHQVRLLLSEALQRGRSASPSVVDRRREPVGELPVEVAEVAEFAPLEK